MKHTRNTIRATLVVVVVAALAVVIAPQAFAAAPSAAATLTGGPVNPGGTGGTFTFAITASSRTLAGYTLSAPAGWRIESIVGTPSPGGTATFTASGISVTGVSASPSTTASVSFTANACVAGSSAWTYTATDSQGRPYGTPSTVTTSVDGASCSLDIVNQPTNAKQNQLITGNPFQGGADNVTVQLLDGNGVLLTTYPVTVTFNLATTGVDENGQGLVAGGPNNLSVSTEATSDGVATFDTQLQIAEKNEAEFTSYSLVPQTTGAPTITGAQSNGFDIWETQCATAGCSVSLRGANLDLYTSPANGDLSASTLPFNAGTNIVCAGQTVIFGDSVFEHEFAGTGAVFLKSHVTRADMKNAANNGQAHVQWCVGLPDPAAWVHNGSAFTEQDTNGPAPLGTLFVGIAPACPNANPQDFAPCISRQYGDGNGGSFTEGYLPADPVRRT
jgi:hypothetical protein